MSTTKGLNRYVSIVDDYDYDLNGELKSDSVLLSCEPVLLEDDRLKMIITFIEKKMNDTKNITYQRHQAVLHRIIEILENTDTCFPDKAINSSPHKKDVNHRVFQRYIAGTLKRTKISYIQAKIIKRLYNDIKRESPHLLEFK